MFSRKEQKMRKMENAAMKGRWLDTLAGDGKDIFQLFEEGADVSEANAGGVDKPPTCLARSATNRSTAYNAPGTHASACVSALFSKRGKSRSPILSCTLGSLLTVLLLGISTIANAEQSTGAAGNRSQLRVVKECIETLIQHGTDRYGKTKTPMLVSILDIETRSCPANPKPLDEAWRVTRRERRNPAGANLLTDQSTLKAMYALSEITGNGDYAAFADRYAGYVMKNLVDNWGFFWWGWRKRAATQEDGSSGSAKTNPSRYPGELAEELQTAHRIATAGWIAPQWPHVLIGGAHHASI